MESLESPKKQKLLNLNRKSKATIYIQYQELDFLDVILAEQFDEHTSQQHKFDTLATLERSVLDFAQKIKKSKLFVAFFTKFISLLSDNDVKISSEAFKALNTTLIPLFGVKEFPADF